MKSIPELARQLERIYELGVSPDDPRIAPIVEFVNVMSRPKTSVYVHELNSWFDSPAEAAKRLGVKTAGVKAALAGTGSLYLARYGICVHLDRRDDYRALDAEGLNTRSLADDRVPNVWHDRTVHRLRVESNCAHIDPDGDLRVICHPKNVARGAIYLPKRRMVLVSDTQARQLIGVQIEAEPVLPLMLD